MAAWTEPAPVIVPDDLRDFVGGHPLVAETLARRGITNLKSARAFLSPEFYEPAPPTDLPGMAEAVERVRRAIADGEQICVWGDFDVDGQTSTSLLVEALTLLGGRVFHHIPVRESESHGVNLPFLKNVIERGAQLVLTCDTGIASHEPLAYARRAGVDVVVTDHHTLPEELPEAAALVNPQMLPEGHPLRTLPGVGVAYKLAEALFAAAGRSGEEQRLLDLVALGIVADVAEQVADTRYLLQLGLELLRRTPRAGLQALFETAGIENPQHLNEETIGFAIGPRLNALGRLGDANSIVEFLTTDDPARARVTAEILEGLNARRRAITEDITQGARLQLEKNPELGELPALVIAQRGWHPGIIGIVASRLVEQFGKPVILIAVGEDGAGRASGRSVEGVNITRAIATQRERLIAFGGHPMAAGLAIREEEIEAFRRGFSKAVARQQEQAGAPPEMRIDGYLQLGEISERLVADLDRLAPFGAGNPPLVFAARNLVVRTRQQIGRNGDHLRLVVRDPQETLQEVLWWRGANEPQPEGEFDLAFNLRMNDFQGRRSVQAVWLDVRPVEAPRQVVEAKRSKLHVVDCREAVDPEKELRRLLEAQEDSLAWGEASPETDLPLVARDALRPADALAIWTSPPDALVLAEALERVRPRTVYLFAHPPATQDFRSFMERLAGLCKFAAAKREGQAALELLAGRLAQPERTVVLGLDWLSAAGHYGWSLEGGEVMLTAGRGFKSARLPVLEEQIGRLLEEAAAYRGMFSKAPAAFLIVTR